MKRRSSFGENGKSLLDKIIEQVRLRKIISLIPQNSRILDLGCGYQGAILTAVEPFIKQGVGMDLSVGTTKNKKITLIKGRVDHKLPFESRSFDLVMAIAIIEHVENPELMLREIYRVLKPGGTVVITTPSLYGKLPLEIMAKLNIISKEEIEDHKRYYEIKSLRKALLTAGFVTERIAVSRFGLMYMNLLAKASK